MSNCIEILPDKQNDKYIVKSCKLSFGDTTEIHKIKMPIKFKSHLSDLADPWVICSLHKMMRVGGDVFVNAPVSKSLLDSLESYCECWYYYKPEYKKIKIIPTREYKDTVEPINDDAILTFSGGLDACFSLYRHTAGLVGRNNKTIKQAILIYGMADTPLNKPDEFKAHLKNAQELCTDRGVPLDVVETNFCDFPNDWEMEHFNILVCILYFFKDYPNKLTASTLTAMMELQKPWSSNAVTDPMLSCNNVKVISDSVAYARTEKAIVIRNWDLAKKKMRVCWEGKDKSKNCGCCEKCMRTMLNFILAGEKEHLQMFEEDAYKNISKNVKNITHFASYQWTNMLKYMDIHPEVKDEELIKIIKQVLNLPNKTHKKKHRHSLWWHIRHMNF